MKAKGKTLSFATAPLSRSAREPFGTAWSPMGSSGAKPMTLAWCQSGEESKTVKGGQRIAETRIRPPHGARQRPKPPLPNLMHPTAAGSNVIQVLISTEPTSTPPKNSGCREGWKPFVGSSGAKPMTLAWRQSEEETKTERAGQRAAERRILRAA